MKKINNLILVSVISSAISYNAAAQNDFNNVIKVNPFSFIVGNCTMFYERGVNEYSTLQLGINFMLAPVKTFGTSFSCYGVTPEYRIYLSHRSIDVPGGGYVAPWFRYRCFMFDIPTNIQYKGITIQTPPEHVTDDQFALGFVLGYEYVSERALALDLFAGPFYNTNRCYNSVGPLPAYDMGLLGNNGLGFRIGVGIGFAFY